MWRDVVLVAELGAGHAAAAAALGPEGVGGDGLDVALGRQGDDELLVVDEVLDVHVAGVEGDLRAALVGELLAHLGQLVLDDLRSSTSSPRIASSSAIVVAELGHLASRGRSGPGG